MKKIIIFVSVFILIFVGGSYLVVSESSLSKNVKKLFPNNLKFLLKETIFIIPKLKKENQQILKKLEILDKKVQVLSTENEKMLGLKLYNDPFNPKLDTKNLTLAKFFLTGKPHNFAGYQQSYFYKGRYIEKFKKNLIILDSFKFYTTSIDENIFDIEKINLKKITSNIETFTNIVGIRDIKIIKDELFLFGIVKNPDISDCYNIVILNSKLNFDKSNNNFNKIIFDNFLKFNICEENIMQSGGRIDEFKENHIIVSFGDFGTPSWDGKEEDFFSDNSYFGKIISINLKTKEKNILSKGHRNPQGLIYIKEKNIIINTEHGPKGGDEININFLDKIYNFGWPIASYGIRYNGEDPFQKDHKNFDEPIKYYNPSIAPSQIISKNNNDSFYFATLKDTSLHEMKFSKDFSKILSEKSIFIGERIRDIIYVNKGIYGLTLDNSPAIAFVKFHK